MKILCIGEEWKGSNASALFYALSRIGCVTNIVNELKYVSVNGSSVFTKAINRSIRKFQVDDFNQQLRPATRLFKPDLVLVYKGAFILPETILFWKQLNIPVVNFFPDVSFLAHGTLIPRCITLYDHIFTTKSFGAQDLYKNFNIPPAQVTFIPHGFDPLVHQKFEALQGSSELTCDVSFIGGYTPHKLEFLSFLTDQEGIDLKIWGSGWGPHRTDKMKTAIQAQSVFGDLYALAIQSSKVNIALLSEQVRGASSGDQITSRTFHIPGSGGFMLHQRTEEVKAYFDEDKEVACFDTKAEMVDKVQYYLKHDDHRNRIMAAGHRRALNDHSIDNRAKKIIDALKDKSII